MSDTFTKTDVTFTVCQRSAVPLTVVHFLRKRMVRMLFLLADSCFLWGSGRLCVDPDCGRDDPRDGP